MCPALRQTPQHLAHAARAIADRCPNLSEQKQDALTHDVCYNQVRELAWQRARAVCLASVPA
jgi:hypothetical protein